MKQLLSIIILFAFFLSADAEDLVITKLNPSPIKIGNKTLTKGGTFSDTDIIYWSSEKQDMKAKPKSGGLPRHFSAAAFKNKGKKSLSVKQYYNKTNHPSTLGIDMALQESNTKDKFPEKRIALVIGNSLYQYMPDLDCPISDAEDVSDQLSELGFDTYTLYDVNNEDFINALKKFSGAAQSYDVALVYYCGHGNQNDGMNYLLPVNAKNDKPDDIELWVSFDFIFKKMAETDCKSKILFLNACRNTPGWKKAETDSRLDRYDTNGSLVVYSTSNGEVALAEDEEMRNTPFTASFLANVVKPADNISQTIQSISVDLREKTRYLEDYGESPQQVYTFGIGDVDFSFVKLLYSVEECRNAAYKAEKYISEGDLYSAISLCLGVFPKNNDLRPIPYTVDVESALRQADWNLYYARNAPITIFDVPQYNDLESDEQEFGIVPQNLYIWTCSDDITQKLNLYDIQSGALIHDKIKCGSGVTRNSFSPDGKYLVINACKEYKSNEKDSDDFENYRENSIQFDTIQIWNLKEASLHKSMAFKDNYYARFFSNGKWICADNLSSSLFFYDANSLQESFRATFMPWFDVIHDRYMFYGDSKHFGLYDTKTKNIVYYSGIFGRIERCPFAPFCHSDSLFARIENDTIHIYDIYSGDNVGNTIKLNIANKGPFITQKKMVLSNTNDLIAITYSKDGTYVLVFNIYTNANKTIKIYCRLL